MRLVSLLGGGIAAVEGAQLVELGPAVAGRVGGDTMLHLIGLWGEVGFEGLAELAAAAPRRPLEPGSLAAPVPLPGAVVAAPVNYVDHRVEMSEVRDISSLGVFLKARSSVTGPGATVRLPYVDRRFDHEGELGVVLGRTVRDLSEEAALEAVFGYTCLLDITMRGGEDRSTRKSFPTFTPTGPWIVTADELADPGDLRLTCAVNGVLRQEARTSDLIWSVERLLAYVSSVMTLYPGDLLATGTPAGVGPIQDGDEVAVEIERVGRLVVAVSAEGAGPCPTLGASSGPVPPPPPPR